MSNPTSNFGWQMPTNTDLVTDLPADFEVFGQAVDTSLADLKGGTTGQILSKATNADMDFVWTSANPGDITGVTAGTGISGGGTSGDVTITNSMATAIDAKGDLIVGTGADTFSRLAVGTNNQVLTADSTTATGTKWATVSAGGMTLLASGTMNTATTTLSSISGAYKDLVLYIQNVKSSSAWTMSLNVQSSTGTSSYSYYGHSSATAFNVGSQGQSSIPLTHTTQSEATAGRNAFAIYLPDYSAAAAKEVQLVNAQFVYEDSGAVNKLQGNVVGQRYNQSTAITSLAWTVSAGTVSGGSYRLYGVN